jgi:hypothetical protein
LSRVEPQQPRCSDRATKDRHQTSVKALGAEAGRNRFPNAPRRLVANNDGSQHVLTAGACPFGDGERGSDKGGAGMDDIPQVAVV